VDRLAVLASSRGPGRARDAHVALGA
jgi:hypothetical protein